MNTDIDLLFKIAGVGILVAVLNQVLSKAGREDQAMMTTLTGVIIVLMMVISKISELFNLSEIKSKNYNFLSNARQVALVKQALISIDNAIGSVEMEMPLEMIAVDIKDAFDKLGEIIGVTYKDELLDELFSKFCLGK